MFVFVSKLAFALAKPSNLIVVFSLVFFVGSLIRPRGRAHVLLGLTLVISAIAAFPPTTAFMLEMLEDRFPRPDKLEPAPTGIIVLGGAQDTHLTKLRGSMEINDAGERMAVVPELARLYPDAKIVVSGGNDARGPDDPSEASIMKQLLVSFGVPAERIVAEDRSRSTWENAVFSRELIKPEPGTRWLLVTSGWHMPRSVGTFRAAGWPGVVAYPVDYQTGGADDLSASYGGASRELMRFDVAVKEFIGLVAYRLSGRSEAFFPAP